MHITYLTLHCTTSVLDAMLCTNRSKRFTRGAHEKGSTMSTNVPTVPLTSGTEIPAMGYGVFQMTSAEVEKHLPEALAAGGTPTSTPANAYFNEVAVGRAHQGVRRRRARGPLRHDEALPAELPLRAVRARHRCHAPVASIWITSTSCSSTSPTATTSPAGRRWRRRWRAGARCAPIGLSNFPIHKIDEILAVATIKPAVLQVEINPYCNQHELKAALAERGLGDVVFEGWYPLGHGRRQPHGRAPLRGARPEVRQDPPRRSSCAGATRRTTSRCPRRSTPTTCAITSISSTSSSPRTRWRA